MYYEWLETALGNVFSPLSNFIESALK